LTCHLAQANFAIARYAYDDSRFSGFVDNLDRINALADSAPGFVWRRVNDESDQEVQAVFGEDELIFNMSVWESREALNDYVYQTAHVDILRKKADWFVPQNRPTMTLWWQAAGTLPAVAEAKRRLEVLADKGPTAEAFAFRSQFPAPQTVENSDG
jgi:hypothetical protein